MKNDEPLRVLRFWRDLEVFNIPLAPTAKDAGGQTTVTTLRRHAAGALPWQSADFVPDDAYGYVHVVHIGVADMEDLAQLVLRSLFQGVDLSEKERQRLAGNGWLAAFVVNELGQPKSDSYLPASFVHGVAALREKTPLDGLNYRLDRAKEEFAQRCHPLQQAQAQPDDGRDDAGVGAAAPALDWNDLDGECDIVRRLLGPAASDARLDWRVVVRTMRVKRPYLDESLQSGADFMNSFYLGDLDRLIGQAGQAQPFGAALRAYLGPALDEQQRTDILTDNAAMARLVSARRLPSARWPASPQHPLVLAQQAAVAQVVDALGGAGGLIGVNGPPGTGKTTLLCDVIAEIVTGRARRIAVLSRPLAVFADKQVVAGKGFCPLKAEVMDGTSIVVTSTNNNAVKNITQELPARKKIADEFASADYFADVMYEVFRAQKVVDDDKQPLATWGTIAAALGNAGNRRSFARGFFRDEYLPQTPAADVPGSEGDPAPEAKPPSMKQILEAASNEYLHYQDQWHKAKHAFLALQAEFDRCRATLEQAEAAARCLDDGQSRLDSLANEAHALDAGIRVRDLALAQHRIAQTDQRAVVNGAQAVLDASRAAILPSLWDRLLGLFGHESKRMAGLRSTLAAPTRALSEATAALADMAKEGAVADAELRQWRERHQAVSSERAGLERQREPHRKALQAGVDMGALHFPDARFWAFPAAERHRASIAVGPRLDDLRAKLFLQAVELHRLTVLANAGKFIANLRVVNGMLTGGSRDKLLPEHRPMLWDVFFFIVPVVSTTLASFDRLFVGMGQDSLGWLLIDEAGQATPQSAAGAIWRSRRAVIVGDPLQIEPVFTVPLSLVERLRDAHGVGPQWSPIDESVQTLADRITPFGSWVDTAADASQADASQADVAQRLWTGMPLRTHRRCDDPMFAVANRIAYADQMVQGRVDTAGKTQPWDFSCELGPSAWFDVRSDRVTHPVSLDEIECLLACLAQVQPTKGANTKMYVISPFRKVAQACREQLRANGIAGIECGTVHTFQGKEAEIVFLVLGTAPGQAGAGARSWAASKPNLLNVAVTRAKCRLYVIGDASQWGVLDHFGELRGSLPIVNAQALLARRQA